MFNYVSSLLLIKYVKEVIERSEKALVLHIRRNFSSSLTITYHFEWQQYFVSIKKLPFPQQKIVDFTRKYSNIIAMKSLWSIETIANFS